MAGNEKKTTPENEVAGRGAAILAQLENRPEHNPATRNPFATAQAVARKLNAKGRSKPEVFRVSGNGRHFTSYDVRSLGIVDWSPADKAQAEEKATPKW